jgi:hypothetical protein
VSAGELLEAAAEADDAPAMIRSVMTGADEAPACPVDEPDCWAAGGPAAVLKAWGEQSPSPPPAPPAGRGEGPGDGEAREASHTSAATTAAMAASATPAAEEAALREGAQGAGEEGGKGGQGGGLGLRHPLGGISAHRCRSSDDCIRISSVMTISEYRIF